MICFIKLKQFTIYSVFLLYFYHNNFLFGYVLSLMYYCFSNHSRISFQTPIFLFEYLAFFLFSIKNKDIYII
nr:MAG TPA: hypothetical protein [Caudoviricetes sp.]